MRPGHNNNNNNKRMRGRHRSGGGGGGGGKGPNPLTRSYESNGPDVKVRGTAQHIVEKYVQLARDAQSSGDPVAAENYLQHAEHYFRLIAAAQQQLQQQQGYVRQADQNDQVEQSDEDEDGDDDAPFASASQPYELRQVQQPYQGNRQNERQGERGDRERGDRSYNDRSNGDRQRQPFVERQPATERAAQDEPHLNGASAASEPQPYINDGAEGAERRERAPRPERGERRRGPRAPLPPREADVDAALPSFITSPVRQSIPIETASSEADAASSASPALAPEGGEAEGERFPFRARRRRRGRAASEGSDETNEALGEDTPAPAGE